MLQGRCGYLSRCLTRRCNSRTAPSNSSYTGWTRGSPSLASSRSWDVLSRRAVFPAPDKDKDKDTVIETGLSGRPIPVEQAGPRPRLGRTMLTQLAEPFISTRTETR